MTTHTIDIDILLSDYAAGYFSRADRRIRDGFRMALELLRLPVPDYALRQQPGRTPAKDVAAAYSAGNPAPRFLQAPATNASTSPARITAAVAKHRARAAAKPDNSGTSRPDPEQPARNLFNDLFG